MTSTSANVDNDGDPELLAKALFMDGADVCALGQWWLQRQPRRGNWSQNRVEQFRFRGGEWRSCCGICGRTLGDWSIVRHVRERHLVRALRAYKEEHGRLYESL